MGDGMDLQTLMKDKYLLAVVESLSGEVLTTDRIAKRNLLPYPGCSVPRRAAESGKSCHRR